MDLVKQLVSRFLVKFCPMIPCCTVKQSHRCYHVVFRGRTIDQRLIVYHKQHLTYNITFKMTTPHLQSDRMAVTRLTTEITKLDLLLHSSAYMPVSFLSARGRFIYEDQKRTRPRILHCGIPRGLNSSSSVHNF